MRKRKLISYILIFSFAFLLSSGVRAACDDENIVTVTPGSTGSGFSNSVWYAYCSGGGSGCSTGAAYKQLPTLNYRVTKTLDGQTVQMDAFCLDPEYYGPGDSSGAASSQKYCLTEITSTGFRDAMVYLYRNGAPSGKLSLSEGDAWQATNIAARLVAIKKGFARGNGNIVYNSLSGPVFQRTQSLIDSGFYDEFVSTGNISNLKTKMGINGVNINSSNVPALFSEGNAGSLQAAIKLYKSAIGASYSATELVKLTPTASVDDYNIYTSGSNVVADVKLTIAGLNNLAGDSVVSNPRIKVDSNPGFVFKYYSDANYVNQITNITNLKNLISGGKLTVYVRITGASNLQPKLLSSEFKTYLDVLDKNSALNVQIATPITNTSLQRMVVFNSSANTLSNMSFKLGATSSNACRIYNGKYCITENGIENCNKTLTQFVSYKSGICCNKVTKSSLSNSDQTIWDRYCGNSGGLDPDCVPSFRFPSTCDPSGSDATGWIKESNNYRKCIIDKKDYNGDDHQTKIITSNNYCKVYCKEDYEYTFPGRQYNVAAGTYFKLKDAKITGTRSCVADIDVDRFLSDLRAANENVTRAYNEYINWYNAVNRAKETTRYWGGCRATAPGRSYRPPICPTPPATGSCYGGQSACSGGSVTEPGCNYTDFTWVYKSYRYNQVNSGNTASMENITSSGSGSSPSARAGSCSCGTCGSSCSSSSCRSYYPSMYSSNLSSARSSYNSAVSARQSIIDKYKSCSSWANDHNFNPVIDYEYEEEMYDDMLTGFDVVPGSRSSSTRDYYYQEKANDYFDGGSGSSYTRSEFLVECDVGSGSDGKCTRVWYTFPNNRSVKKVSTISQEYRSKDEFYTRVPTGEVLKTGGTNMVKVVDSPAGNYSYFVVLISSTEGLHNFTYTITKSGQSNQNNALDRFDRMFTKYNNNIGTYMKYVCEYEVTGELCKCCRPIIISYVPVCPTCPPIIRPLAGGLNVFYRPISTNDVFPNSTGTYTNKSGLLKNRRPGENWMSPKGQETQMEIESKTGKSTDNAELSPEYSFELTPAQMKRIRQYNHNAENNGVGGKGYNDFNLSCNGDGLECRSKFLRDNATNRVYFNDLANVNGIKWTPWTKTPVNRDSGIGPAWK